MIKTLAITTLTALTVFTASCERDTPNSRPTPFRGSTAQAGQLEWEEIPNVRSARECRYISARAGARAWRWTGSLDQTCYIAFATR